MRRRWLAGIVSLVVLTACSADVESIAPVAGRVAADRTAAEADADAGFSVVRSLEQLPSAAADDTTFLQIFAVDLDAAGEQAGLTGPGNTTDPDELLAFFGPLTGLPRDDRPMRMFVPLPQLFAQNTFAQADDFAAEVGLSIGDVTSFVALDAPPAQFVVAAGVTAPADLPEYVPGVLTIGEADDFVQDLQERSAARPLGRSLRIAELDGRVALSLATPPIVDWLTGPTAGTLADDPALAALARRLDEESVVSAALVVSETDTASGVALGWSADDSGARGVIVFGYESPDAAQARLAVIESGFGGESVATGQPMTDLVTLESIEARGSEIVARVRFPDGRGPSTTWRMLLQQDGPFAADA